AATTQSPPARLTAATTSRQWLKAKIGNSMPKRTQMRVFTSAPCRAEPHRHAFDAVDEVRAQALDPAVELHVGEAPEQLLEHDLDLEPREVRPQAEVVAEAEGEVLVRRSADVEPVRVREDVLVPVGRAVPEGHLVVLTDRLAVELRVVRHRAAEVHEGRDPAEHLLDGGVEERGIVREACPLVGSLQER